MKIVHIIEFTSGHTSVFIRHIHIAATSINDAMAKYNDWSGKNEGSDSFVLNDYDSFSDVIHSSGKGEGRISFDDYKDWLKRMTKPYVIDDVEREPFWLKIV